MRRSQKTGRWPSSWLLRTAEEGGCLMQRGPPALPWPDAEAGGTDSIGQGGGIWQGRDTDREDRGGALHASSDFVFVNDDVERARAPSSNRSSSGSRHEADHEQGSMGEGGRIGSRL
mmetsp:Transcript_19143/g.44803  ORF Transcript_19143/g.44803 Transcript_19143/m.44803 type:complete len:117 (-) Transcript_19143:46-396(-)